MEARHDDLRRPRKGTARPDHGNTLIVNIAFCATWGLESNMTKLLAPRDENELILLSSLLEGNGIDFFVQNEYFGGLYPWLNILPFNVQVILVAEADFDSAAPLPNDFLEYIEGS